MVRSADVTVCVSWLRAEELQAAVPEAAGADPLCPAWRPVAVPGRRARCRGRPSRLPTSHTCPGPLGYIGSMEDRVDWELMDRISRELPDASIVVIGRVRDAGRRALVGRLLAVPGAARTSMPWAGAAGGPGAATTRPSTSP